MRFLRFLFLIFLIFPLIHSMGIDCPNSYCSNNFFPINYPFKLQDQWPQICSDYIDLSCDLTTNRTILNLPFSGDFYVDDIVYFTDSITLYDPGNCLPKRLMNLNLSSSPFSAIKRQSYTFYSCSDTRRLIFDGFEAIGCLSNYPNATVASSTVSPGDMTRLYGCSSIVTLEIPVEWYGQFDSSGIYTNLRLKWNVPDCNDCQEYGDQETDKPLSKVSKFINSTSGYLIITAVGLLVLSSCICIMRTMLAREQANREAAAAATTVVEVPLPPRTTTTTVVSPPHSSRGAVTCIDVYYTCYTRSCTFSTFLEENGGGLDDNGNSCCTICLEEYSPEDTIRCINLCRHYFHANCLNQWFHKNSNCPICRSSIVDVKL